MVLLLTSFRSKKIIYFCLFPWVFIYLFPRCMKSFNSKSRKESPRIKGAGTPPLWGHDFNSAEIRLLCFL
jgi:hypothetical protein